MKHPLSITTFSLVAFVLAAALPARAQFNSGSTGADGALNFSNVASGTTVVFNPKSFNPPLDPAGDNIFNFSTITIPAGVTVRLDSSVFDTPVVWLASGAVEIGGTIDLSGGTGVSIGGCAQVVCRTQAVPGAGGYAGGIPGDATNPATAGQGPGGGAAATASSAAQSGMYNGNSYAIPLVGGSGGGASVGNGGGAGGGALLIASSVSINFGANGYINAGGGSGNAGQGSGGAVRLAAPFVTGGRSNCVTNPNQILSVSVFAGPTPNPGAIRIESFNGGIGCVYPAATYGAPFSTFVVPQMQSSISVVSVNGASVAQPPTGSVQTPDVTINTAGAATLVIQAINVPIGTVVNLRFVSDNGQDIVVTAPPLQGTLAQSTTSVNVTFPSGYTRGFLSASFMQ